MSSILNSTRAITRRFPMPGNRMVVAASTRNTGYSSRHENDPEKLDGHKHNSLAEQREGKGQWHEELASDSEAFVKAEREEIKSSSEEIKKLQKETGDILAKAGMNK